MLICSSKSEGSTTAAAPASSIRRMLSRLSASGLDEATSGLASASPRYEVPRSLMASLPGRLAGGHRCQVLVHPPAQVDVPLCLLEQAVRRLDIAVGHTREGQLRRRGRLDAQAASVASQP